MSSLLEELARREAAARRRIEEIREQIAARTSQMQDEQDCLSRLTITRETVEEILGEAPQLLDGPNGQAGDAVGTAPPVLGVVTVPHWQPGMNTAVLPCAYRDAVEIMADAGRAIRAGQIAVAMGLPDEAAKREGLRSKLKRLVGRGWAKEEGPGLFTVTDPVAREMAGQDGVASRDAIASLPGG